MLKLRINPIVAKDLKNIRDYIAEDNEEYAAKTIKEIYGKFENLQMFPGMGSDLSKQALFQMKILQLQLGMRPADKSLRLFNPMACFGIIAHYLAGSYQPIYICLPENRCTSPF